MEKVANNIGRIAAKSTTRNAVRFETAGLARFADGSCTCSINDTSVLVTAVSEKPVKGNDAGFVPLNVVYKQKAAAAGRIPMTHLRRDIGLTEQEVLTSRMIDRSIRPGFMEGYNHDTQIICNLLAVDGENDPDIIAINGASASLTLSSIPWNGPVGAVRVGLLGEQTLINPTRKELENCRLNLVVTANRQGNLLMMEAASKEPVLQTDIIKSIKSGIKESKVIIESLLSLQMKHGKPKKTPDLSGLPTEEHKQFVLDKFQDKIRAVLTNYSLDKIARDEAMTPIREEVFQSCSEKFPDILQSQANWAFSKAIKCIYRRLISETSLRCDGRKFNQVRTIDCKVDLYKPLHGSALFQRGQTQVFCSTTFDSPDAAFRNDSLSSLLSGIKEKNFMLHYEFPPYATNEVGKVGTMPGRREIGHGALAERSIRPILRSNQDMTVRLNCEVLESNGSSSMASVCAGSMSLMDAGVDIRDHVAGVAMGLMSDTPDLKPDEKVSVENSGILTDILGFEDYFGDMDFKIAGTKKAVTAFQLDVKPTNGINPLLIYQSIQHAHTARGQIIDIMNMAIKTPRKTKKDNHPVMKTIHIPQHLISTFIGFGGANLKKMMATIGVRISSCGEDDASSGNSDLRTTNDNFMIFAPNSEAMKEAEDYIKSILEKQKEPELEFNGIYTATIEEIRPTGVMVTLYANMKPTLLPLSQLDIRTVSHPSALNLEAGQQIQVKYFGRDPASGQMRLSRKSLMMTSAARIHRTPLS